MTSGKKTPPQQILKTGSQSVNLQANGDIHFCSQSTLDDIRQAPCIDCQHPYSARQCPFCAEERSPRINEEGFWRARSDEIALQVSGEELGGQLKLDGAQVALLQTEMGHYETLRHSQIRAISRFKRSSFKAAIFTMGSYSLHFHYPKMGLLEDIELCFRVGIHSTEIHSFYDNIVKPRRLASCYHLEHHLADVVKQWMMNFCSAQDAVKVKSLLEKEPEQRCTDLSNYLASQAPLSTAFNGLEFYEVERLEFRQGVFDKTQQELVQRQSQEELNKARHEYDRNQLAREEERQTAELAMKNKAVDSEIDIQEKRREQVEKDVQLEQQQLLLQREWAKLAEAAGMAEEVAKDKEHRRKLEIAEAARVAEDIAKENEHKHKLAKSAARAEFVLNAMKEQALQASQIPPRPKGMANIRCGKCGADNHYQSVEPELCGSCRASL